MATITPSVVNSPKETMTSKGGYLRLTITSITDSDAETNQRYIGCKLTIEGTRWVGLYRWESTLGGKTVSTETRTVEDWQPGHVLGTKNLTFDNDSAGNLSLTAYIKHIFFKGSSYWNTNYAKQITETLVCSQLPRYANFTSHSATSTLNTITVSYAADAAYGAQQYSLDNGSWTNCTAGSYTLSGFTPGSSHTIKTRIQRSDSGLWTESSQISISLKSLPTSNNVSNINFNSSGTRVDVSISSKDYLSQWYVKIYDGTTLVRDASNAPNYASSTSDYWTILNSDNTNMLNRHGSANSWTLTVKFYVVSNGTTYTLADKTCTCTIPSGSYLPTYNSNNLSYAVQDSESNNITGSNQKVIKGISDVRIFTTQASPQGGASMSSYTATCGTKSGTSTSLSNTYIDLSDVDSNSFSVQATDTRGRSTVASKSYSTYIDYFAPYINSGGINISRVDGVTANININISGKYMNWSSLSTSNTITQVSIQYKLRNSPSWTTLSGFNLSISASSGNFTASGTTTGNVFNIANEYDIRITLKDKLKNVEANGIIYTANVLLWKDLTNHRLGIGKKPTVALDVNGNIKQNSYDVLDKSYLIKHDIATDGINIMQNYRESAHITNVDLNDYTQPGIYGLYGTNTNEPYLHKLAIHNGFQTLTVEAYSSSHIIQTYKCGYWNGGKPRMFIREMYYTDTFHWSDWYEVNLTIATQNEAAWYINRDVHGGLFYGDSADKYLIIRTPVDMSTQDMVRIKLEGYAYGNETPFEIQISWYNYQGSTINYGWVGNGADEVRIGRHTDGSGSFNWLVFHFPSRHYFTRFIVSEYYCNILANANREGIWYSYVSSTLPSFSDGNVVVPKRT